MNFEEKTGIMIILMLAIACIYLYTQSPLVQQIGFYYGLLVIIYCICGFIKSIAISLVDLYEWVKGDKTKIIIKGEKVMKFEVQYEQKTTRTMIIEAESLEEAKKKALNGDYEDDWEEDSSDFRILNIKENELE